MRVMFSVFPATAHFLPMVPLAHALQSAGHEVVVAAPPGIATGIAQANFHESVNAAGVTAVTCGVPEPLSLHDGDGSGWLPTLAESDHYAEILRLSAAERPIWDMFYHFQLNTIHDYHTDKPRQDVEAVVDFARRWQPDLVLWDAWFPAGAVAARVAGAAHARVLNVQDYGAWTLDRFRDRLGASVRDNPLGRIMRGLAERFDVEIDEELLVGQWTLDPMPTGYSVPTTVSRMPVRGVPFTGATVMPEWLHERRTDRPRVALTLGVSLRTVFKGDWGRTPKFIDALADLDVEVIATLDENQLDGVTLPANVRAIDYVPLTQLLPTCAAVIHHGAPGTLVAACAANVPQLVSDTDEPARVLGKKTDDGIEWDLTCKRQVTASPIAQFVVDRGAGLRLNHQTQSVEEIRADIARVLEEPSFRRGANAVHEDWLATPSPAALVPELENLTARHRS